MEAKIGAEVVGQHVNPVVHAERYGDALAREDAAQAAAVRRYTTDLAAAALRGDMAAVATFAPSITDFRATGSRSSFQRSPTVGEVLADSLDYPAGPGVEDLIAFVCRAAVADNQEARALLGRMVRTSATHAEGRL